MAFGWDDALAVGLSLFGGGKKGPNYSGVNPYEYGINAIGGDYARLGGQGAANFALDNASLRKARGKYAEYLGSDPYTDPYSAAVLARSTAGTTNAFTNASNDLTRSLAARGVAPGGSVGAGALTALNGMRANTVAGAQSDLGYRQIADHERRLGALDQLYAGAAGGDLQQAYSGYSGAEGAYSRDAGIKIDEANGGAASQNTDMSGLGEGLSGVDWGGLFKKRKKQGGATGVSDWLTTGNNSGIDPNY